MLDIAIDMEDEKLGSDVQPVECVRRCDRSMDNQLSGWPKSYMYTVYDRIVGDFPAKNSV